ncbi:phenylacetic acid degradation bifunctional protein PaaZ [Streptomyces abyssalis]|uniref:phenylacetic acid degradation bifunctional protein PaaZ n=1 Tax=Streptomyces abyssalis TaxID=933944 RepID=UPI00085BFBDA|nr:phenylacetic acid degradation bifunctional protein PaaZ [Streptomyces abyssalis]
MARTLQSWTRGEWWAGGGLGTEVSDAVTGEPVVSVSSDGLDTAATVAYAREVGGPELRRSGFAARAALVKQLALALKERRGELVELSARTGATAADASVDVDGGIGTALVFASKGAGRLPDGNVLAEDEAEPLGKGGTFAGRHLLSPRRGAAVEINAFNFPVWGMLEKLAPALIAGVPSIVKPATQTAYVTVHAVRVLDESGLLPDGALQLVCGGLGDLLDHLGGQDLVSFTGSAATAAKLRGHEAVTARSVRFNAEADSLNGSVLGPDAVPGTPEFELFTDALVHEMTCKAGQRCTAIRRALVPEALLDQVSGAVDGRLAKTVVGAPGAEGVTMGALAGQAQRRDVLAAVERLKNAATVVAGGGPPAEVAGADAATGAFMAPTLLRCDDPDRAEPHAVEAFGPVSTLIGYRDPAHAVELLARGEGSLVASVVSCDEDAVREVVLGAAAHHGRILVLDREDAAESTGHGTPMPQLVHGGPGRAGGGEEEGGLRAVTHHLQRTAVQASPRVLDALTGTVH